MTSFVLGVILFYFFPPSQATKSIAFGLFAWSLAPVLPKLRVHDDALFTEHASCEKEVPLFESVQSEVTREDVLLALLCIESISFFIQEKKKVLPSYPERDLRN